MLEACVRRSLLASFILAAGCVSNVGAKVVPHLDLSFFFDWNPQGQVHPVPVTQQCQEINIKWQRGAALGPNPVPPYYLQVHTSLYTVPIIIPAGNTLNFDWAVPFPPGTLYQICMYDKNGNTGGCQETYTMIPANEEFPVCTNVTLPRQLEVEGFVNNGPISRYGWIDQVAPSLHPPYNITGGSDALNWTVSLSWSTPFFISVADSAGSMWANGLLHVGGPGRTTSCLAEGATGGTTVQNGLIQPGVAVGTTFLGLVLGVIIGVAAMFYLMRKRLKKTGRESMFGFGLRNSESKIGSPESISSSLPSLRHSSNRVDPFVVSTENGTRSDLSRHQSGQGAVYVLHHDSNAAPVTIFHDQGQEIVELPPRYPDHPGSRLSSPSDSTSGSSAMTFASSGILPSSLQQPRVPGEIRKPT
ncbi:hypothetical protein FA15DRAFT_27440 [Coprinopsis marcescibilis]|uniref:Fibronectin type-III domain-containing protein n=1 Tax=Coprinopsis marcescibilis TaxID=230819 RepID=A0A5C3LF07_COPMA|nr:hypothetical protein FA15DRAFT_27440 [Coprinopsis marcescibilis]